MTKKDIAEQQIKTAARLYNKRDYICSITLSAAAEEILGKINIKINNKNEFEKDIAQRSYLYKFYNLILPRNEIINEINYVKNELKHNDKGINNSINVDFEDEAALFFCKAMRNYFDCYNKYPKDKLTNELFDHLTL